MRNRLQRRRLPWIVPAGVALAVGATALIATANYSDASPSLPARTPAQLLAAVASTTTTALSGQVSEKLDLGLPSLPGDESGASLSWQSLLLGSHTARVWIDGPDKQRLALLDTLSEADVVHNGPNVWTYTSDTNTVSHTVLPSVPDAPHTPTAIDLNPAAVATRLLKAVSPSTEVSVGPTRSVAGRDAYTLDLRPRDSRSTISDVRIAIDAARDVPLDVQVFAGGSSPAFETGFTEISFARPAASIFDFKTPAGANVSTNPLQQQGPGGGVGMPRRYAEYGPGPMSAPTPPKLLGSGWTTVVELSGGQLDGLLNGTLGRLTTSVGSSGARLFSTPLLNAVALPDGRTFVGAVRPSALEALAQSTPR